MCCSWKVEAFVREWETGIIIVCGNRWHLSKVTFIVQQLLRTIVLHLPIEKYTIFYFKALAPQRSPAMIMVSCPLELNDKAGHYFPGLSWHKWLKRILHSTLKHNTVVCCCGGYRNRPQGTLQLSLATEGNSINGMELSFLSPSCCRSLISLKCCFCGMGPSGMIQVAD